MFAPTFTESSTVSSEGSTESSEIFLHIAETETNEISSYEAEAEVLGASKKTEKKEEKKKKKKKRTWVHPGRHPDELSDKARVVLLVPFCGENSDTKMKNLIYCKMPANSTYGTERKFKNRVLYMQNSTA